MVKYRAVAYIRNIFNNYNKLLNKHPYIIQSLQAGILMGTGDVIAQKLLPDKDDSKYKLARTGQFFFIGSFVVGPCSARWYKLLSKLIDSSKYSKTAALRKMALDQLTFAPTFLVIFLGLLNVFEGGGMEEFKNDLRTKYFDILFANYKIWPFVQLVNFYLMPVHYQVLFVQCVALFWNIYLSWKTRHHPKI